MLNACTSRTLVFLFVTSAVVDVSQAIIGGARVVESGYVEPSAHPPTKNVNITDNRLSYAERTKGYKPGAVVNGLANDDGTYSFLGIRYAQPPLERFRFQRPRRVKLVGQVDATKYGPPCPQWNPQKPGEVVGNEDCLFLNVFTPEIPEEGKKGILPVIVWIHGGNYRSGSGAQYLPTDLVKKGVIVVTINYRLGSLGFLTLNRPELPGNVGLFDMSTAMKWVRDYIEHFGGNSSKIVPAGQGSGASCATMMALDSFTQSSLSGVLAMSGSAVSPFALDNNENETLSVVSQELGCQSEREVPFVRCMQNLPVDTILNADSSVEGTRKEKRDFTQNMGNLLGAGPTEDPDDNRFLPSIVPVSPMEAMQSGKFPNIPLMTGITKEETGGGVKGNFFSEVTKKLTSPDFLKKNIFKDAFLANSGLNLDKKPDILSLFSNNAYLDFFKNIGSGSPLSDIQKVVKATSDAFFSLPAFVTSKLWSKKGNNVYMYSFEYTPKKSLASKILGDLPIVRKSKGTDEKTAPEHGDDLIYLFDARGLQGEELENVTLKDPKDKKVRDEFTTMVAEFARTGVPKTIEGEKWEPYREPSGDYMVITDEPKMAKNFKKCDMGLWSGDNDILSSADCTPLRGAGQIAKKTLGSVTSSLFKPFRPLGGGESPPGSPTTAIGHLPSLFGVNQPNGGGGGVFSKLSTKLSSVQSQSEPSLIPTVHKGVGSLGGFFG